MGIVLHDGERIQRTGDALFAMPVDTLTLTTDLDAHTKGKQTKYLRPEDKATRAALITLEENRDPD